MHTEGSPQETVSCLPCWSSGGHRERPGVDATKDHMESHLTGFPGLDPTEAPSGRSHISLLGCRLKDPLGMTSGGL